MRLQLKQPPRYLLESYGHIGLDDFDLEQNVQTFKHSQLDKVVASSQRLEESQTFLEYQLQTSVLLLQETTHSQTEP